LQALPGTRLRRALALAAVTAAALAAAGLAGGASSGGMRVVADHLNNPRGIEIAPDGSVFLAEAGSAGKQCFKTPQGPTCAGFSSRIVRIADGTVEPYATGFFSAGGRDGSFTVGTDDVAISPSGQVYSIQTSAGPKPQQYGPVIAAQSGMLFRIDRGAKTPIADISAYEWKNNPTNDNLDSDPYSVAWSPVGLAVADAAGNSLLQVDRWGRVTTLATFPGQKFGGHAAQSVPTSVVWHNGAFYVGELGGGGTPNGKSRIWKVVPGEKATVYMTGFTAITGIGFGPDGSLYVTELAKAGLGALESGKGPLTGAVIKVDPSGARTELVPGRLTAPAGMAVGPDGTVYVSNNSVFAHRGQLVAIDQG
jgi:hypothetical protein